MKYCLKAQNYFYNRYFDGGVCKCTENGKSTEFQYNEDKWCCHTSKCEVVESNEVGSATSVQCNGTTLGLQQQCHNQDTQTPTCNFYKDDAYRNEDASRSYMDICQDGRYILMIFFDFS